jgi:hypothetical protein
MSDYSGSVDNILMKRHTGYVTLTDECINESVKMQSDTCSSKIYTHNSSISPLISIKPQANRLVGENPTQTMEKTLNLDGYYFN